MKNEKQQWVSIKVDDETTAIAEQIEHELGIESSRQYMHAACLQRAERDEPAARCVKQGHRVDPDVFGICAYNAGIEPAIAHEPAVRQQRPLGKSSRAGDACGKEARESLRAMICSG